VLIETVLRRIKLDYLDEARRDETVDGGGVGAVADVEAVVFRGLCWSATWY
jgi:hypothetical protein